MNKEAARAKAKEILGDKGYVYDRKGLEGDGIDWGNTARYYVGDGNTCGNGNTWEEAFDNLPKHILAKHQQSAALKDKL